MGPVLVLELRNRSPARLILGIGESAGDVPGVNQPQRASLEQSGPKVVSQEGFDTKSDRGAAGQEIGIAPDA